MRIALYNSLIDTLAKPLELATFRDLFDYLESNPYCGPKDRAPLWSPVELAEGATTRAGKSIARITAAVVDIDDIKLLDYTRIVLPNLASYEAIVHSSASNYRAHQKGNVRCRVILPLSRPVTPREWRKLWPRIWDDLGVEKEHKEKGIGGGDAKAANDCARAFFVWTSIGPIVDPSVWIQYKQGAQVEVDKILSSAWKKRGQAPTVRAIRSIARSLKQSSREETTRVGTALQAVAKGVEFGEPGERDDLLFRMVSKLVQKLPGARESELCSLFAESIDAMQDQDDPLTSDIVTEKVARLKEQAESEESEEHVSLLRKRWRKSLMLSGRRHVYSEDELEEFASRLNVSREILSSCWVLQRGMSYYLLADNAEYMGPYSATELPERAQVILAPADSEGVTVCKVSDKGKISRKRPADLVDQYGLVIDGVEKHLCLQRSQIVMENMAIKLAFAPCPVREIEPQEDPEIAHWLAMLGGNLTEYLLDWLACLTKLSEPVQALYIEGDAGIGKNLLASGLARLWTDQGPTTLDTALGPYNEKISRCPLIHGDERIPTDNKGKPLLDELKRLISDYQHDTREIYQPGGQTIGAVRVLITANNRRMLGAAAELTSADVQALVDRLIHIRVHGSDAPAYLRSLGQEKLKAWVQGDKIAAHALYLRETRTVERGRFLIKPAPNTMIRALVVSVGTRAAICHGLVQWLTSGQVGASGLIFVEDAILHVSAKGLYEHWDDFGVGKRPSLAEIASKLTAMALSVDGSRLREIKGVQVKCWRINTNLLSEWSKTHGYASHDDIVSLLKNPPRRNLAPVRNVQ